MSCYNCTIEGITWNRCGGRNDSNNQSIQPVLQLSNSTNIIIKYCSIQKSVGQALVLSGVSGDVILEYCRFLRNKQYGGHGIAIHFSSSISYVKLTIANCNFYANSYAQSVVYFGASFSSNLHTSHIHIQDTSFHYNTAIPIYLSNQKLNIHGKMDFHRNAAEAGGGINIRDFSEVIFQNTTSVNFTYNTADSRGGAIYLTNHSRVLFSTLYQTDDTFVNEKVSKTFMFYQNRARDFGKDIYAYHHSYVMFGNSVIVMFTGDGQHFESTTNALYADFYSNVTFEGNSEVTFKISNTVTVELCAFMIDLK